MDQLVVMTRWYRHITLLRTRLVHISKCTQCRAIFNKSVVKLHTAVDRYIGLCQWASTVDQHWGGWKLYGRCTTTDEKVQRTTIFYWGMYSMNIPSYQNFGGIQRPHGLEDCGHNSPKCGRQQSWRRQFNYEVVAMKPYCSCSRHDIMRCVHSRDCIFQRNRQLRKSFIACHLHIGL